MKKITKMDPTIAAIIRVIVTIVAAVNAVLVAQGKSPIPFDEEAVTMVLSYIAAGVMILYSSYKDMPITKEAREGTGLTRMMKAKKKGLYGEDFFDEDTEE